MKKILALLFLLKCLFIYSQIGINTDEPEPYTSLHISERRTHNHNVPDVYSGVIIERYSQEEIDSKLTPYMQHPQNSLLIYNTTEDCYNYWKNIDHSWKSLCGEMGKSVINPNCSQITINGFYIEKEQLNSTNNYLLINLEVTKPGSYTVIGSSKNGYDFYTTGSFLSSGNYKVHVPGLGTPINPQIDTINITINGNSINCENKILNQVKVAAGNYTLSCWQAEINGSYKLGQKLTSANTITMPIIVTKLGSYSISTKTVDGINFNGFGNFTSLGNQTITLYGSGIPESAGIKSIEFITDGNENENSSIDCSLDLLVVMPKKRLLSIGLANNSHGYNFAVDGTASNKLITTQTNYGNLPNSRVNFEGWEEIINGGNSPSYSTLSTWTTGDNPVDIIILGNSFTPSLSVAGVLADYVKRGGILLAFTQHTGNAAQNIMRSIFDNDSITVESGPGGSRSVLEFFPISDLLLDGPFGDVRGKNWGPGISGFSVATNLPINDIIAYSNADFDNAEDSGPENGITGFRHSKYNFLWFGGEHFNGASTKANEKGNYPFKVNSSNFPVPKKAYGTAEVDVYNSIFTANAIAWAIKQADINGINSNH